MRYTRSTASSSMVSVPSRLVRKSSDSRLHYPPSTDPAMDRTIAECTSNNPAPMGTKSSATIAHLTTEEVINSNRSSTKGAAKRGPIPANVSTETTTRAELKISMHPTSTDLAMGIRGTTTTRINISIMAGETITAEVDIRGKTIRGSNMTGSHCLNIRGKTTVLRPIREGISSSNSRTTSNISSQLLSSHSRLTTLATT